MANSSKPVSFQIGDIVDTPRGVGSVAEIKGSLCSIMVPSGHQFVYHAEDIKKIFEDVHHLQWALGLFHIGDVVETPEGSGTVWNIYHEGQFYFVFVRFHSGLCVKYAQHEVRLIQE
ncbi:MAG: hypothetical protein HY036_10930 [Nitrospirae bacterium]|nr:hypothetical protein [Nitrospirota bacterium]MBI3353077.1 hypothetical protein [Nitrospirota bacterium]